MRVLVTGSTGFIGGALCRALVLQGHQVRAFHRPSSTLRLLEDLPVEHALGDLTRPETVQAAMEGIEAVFHTAALLGGGRDEPGRMYAVTVEGTRAVLQAARQAGVKRVVHTSSVAALGVPPRAPKGAFPISLNENHTWNYRSDYWPYGYAKYLAELEVQRAVAQGLDAVIVNPTLVFGAGDVYRQTSSLVVLLGRQRLPRWFGGRECCTHCDVWPALAPWSAAGSERYILGGENLTLADLVRKIAAVAGVSAPLVMLPAGLARRLIGPLLLVQSYISFPVGVLLLHLAGMNFYYDGRKARSELGLTSLRPIDDALREAYAWFQARGTLAKEEEA